VAMNYRVIVAFFSKRSSKLGTNAGVLGLAVIAILVADQLPWAYRHQQDFSIGPTEKLFTLSDENPENRARLAARRHHLPL